MGIRTAVVGEMASTARKITRTRFVESRDTVDSRGGHALRLELVPMVERGRRWESATKGDGGESTVVASVVGTEPDGLEIGGRAACRLVGSL